MVRKAFSCDFLLFFGRLGSAKNGLKPCVLRGFCDLRSHAKVLGTSCCKKGLEGVFGRFLARLGREKSAKNIVFYKCFVIFSWVLDLRANHLGPRSDKAVKAI